MPSDNSLGNTVVEDQSNGALPGPRCGLVVFTSSAGASDTSAGLFIDVVSVSFFGRDPFLVPFASCSLSDSDSLLDKLSYRLSTSSSHSSSVIVFTPRLRSLIL